MLDRLKVIVAFAFIAFVFPAQQLASSTGKKLVQKQQDLKEQVKNLGNLEGKKTKDGEVFELPELMEIARNRDTFEKEYRNKVSRAEWRKYRADWAATPKLKALTTVAPVPANADPNELDQNYDEIAALNIGPFVSQELDLIVPLYTFGRIPNAQKLASIGVENEKIKRRRAVLDVYYKVKRAYYSLQLSNTLKTMLSDGAKLLEEKLADMQEARDFGTADFSTKELRKLQIFNARVDAKQIDNRRLGDLATEGLYFLTRIEKDKLAVPNMETNGSLGQLKERQYYLEFAFEKRPQILQLKRAVEARRLQKQLAKSEFYPNLFMAGRFSYGWSTEETAKRPVCELNNDGECVNLDDRFVRPFSDPLDRFSFQIGLGLRWNFDFPQQRGKLQQKRAQYQVIVAQYKRAKRAIRLDVKKLFREAKDARKKVKVMQRKKKAARRWRTQFGLSMQSGGAELEDAVDPLKEHFKAQAQYLRALYEYTMARASLAKGIGAKKLLESGEAQIGKESEIFNSR